MKKLKFLLYVLCALILMPSAPRRLAGLPPAGPQQPPPLLGGLPTLQPEEELPEEDLLAGGTGLAANKAVAADVVKPAVSHNIGSVTVSANAVNTVRSAILNRLTDVKGNGNDPFISLVYGRLHQGMANGIGYDSNLKGISGGLDWVFKFSDERYLRMGAVMGYVKGSTKFFGSAAGKRNNMDSDVYTGGLFTAYESFGKNNLKTNINVFVGLGYTKNKLARVDDIDNLSTGWMSSRNQFIQLEIVKNLWIVKDMEYNNVTQKNTPS